VLAALAAVHVDGLQLERGLLAPVLLLRRGPAVQACGCLDGRGLGCSTPHLVVAATRCEQTGLLPVSRQPAQCCVVPGQHGGLSQCTRAWVAGLDTQCFDI
jgi:hypothetical protein